MKKYLSLSGFFLIVLLVSAPEIRAQTPPFGTVSRYPTRAPIYWFACRQIQTYVNGKLLGTRRTVKRGDKVVFVAYGSSKGRIIKSFYFKLFHKNTGRLVFTQVVPAYRDSSGAYTAKTKSYAIRALGSYQITAQML